MKMRLTQSQRVLASNTFFLVLGFWIGWMACTHYLSQRTFPDSQYVKATPKTVASNECPPAPTVNNLSTIPVQIYAQTIAQRTLNFRDSIHSMYNATKLDTLLAKNKDVLGPKVTVVCFCADEQAYKSIEKFLDNYPNTKVLTGSARGAKRGVASSRFDHIGEFKSKGEALNKLIAKVNTDYFLHLDTYHSINEPTSDQSVGWLLQSLEKVKSIDLIGGSVHVEKAHRGVYDTLEIPCYRLHHYNYTYSETYEYRESIVDIMLCERTSSSFLANTSAFRSKRLSFDPNLNEMIFEDFFLQAKAKSVVVATKPEVYFTVRSSNNQQPSAVQHVTTKFTAGLIPFGLKYQVMTIKDINRKVLSICERYSTLGTSFEDKSLGRKLFKDESLLCDYDKTKPYWKMKHWAFGGMFAPPTMMMALKRSLALAGEFFDEMGWIWTLIGGGTLGAVKMRGFLPWEAGDIDITVNVTQKVCYHGLKTKFVRKYPDYEVLNHTQVRGMHSYELLLRPKHGFGGWVTLFFGIYGKIKKTVRVNLDGYWAQCSYYMFNEFRRWYGLYYLQHKMYDRNSVRCSEKSNTCLPDYTKLYGGRGGVWKEFFDED